MPREALAVVDHAAIPTPRRGLLNIRYTLWFGSIMKKKKQNKTNSFQLAQRICYEI